jgi:hypothetical protein
MNQALFDSVVKFAACVRGLCTHRWHGLQSVTRFAMSNRSSGFSSRATCFSMKARYTHRVAISNERLVSLANGTVAFRVRDNANVGKKRIERLPAQQFIGRFLLHVLPPGFKRIRHYGMLANTHKHRQLALCRQALEVPAPDAAGVETVDAFLRRVTGVALACCPHCGQAAMRLMEVIAPRRQHPCATGPP